MGTRTARLAAAAAAGALAARATLTAVRNGPHAERLQRVNFRGHPVTLAGGPAVAVGAALGAAVGAPGAAAAAAALTAGLAAGAVGMYDDIVGARPEQKAAKGFAGHLAALRRGQLTSGLVKIAGIGAAGLAAGALLATEARRATGRPGRRGSAGVLDVLVGAGVVAGTANLLNLLDLRPGRALKAGVLLAAPLAGGPAGGLATGALGAAGTLLPADLGEEIMLGDAGANALGAVLGVALAARTGPLGRAGILTVLAALTAASERVSFTQVIGRTPVLRELDAAGRRPL